MDFGGKKALVTGASRGIGRAIALQLSELGCNVIGTATKASSEINDYCSEVIEVDFTDESQTLECVEAIKGLGLDILVNNAGINKVEPFCDISLSDFTSIQQVNLTAPFLLCQAVLPHMKNQSWGRIVNVSSIWGKISKEYRASYSASKFALDGMTVALSCEYAQYGVLANCIAPGFTDTELTRSVLGDEQIATLVQSVPARKMANVVDIANLVCWLVSSQNSYVTGQNIATDGGFSRA